jgi:hypothetical protein
MSNQTKISLIGWAGFILFLVMFLQDCGCGKCPQYQNQQTVVTQKVYDSVPKIVPVKSIVTKLDSFIVEVPAVVDTNAILQKYFNQYFYSHAFNDSTIKATIYDTVSQNKITGISFKYQLLKPTEIITVINNPVQVAKPSRNISAGIFLAADTKGANAGFGAQITFKTAKQTMYDARYDLLQKRIELGASYILSFKK